MKLTKSDSGSKSHPRRSRTLKRGADFRGFEEDDVKYLWACYKKGSKNGLLDNIPENLSAEEFKETVINLLLTHCDFGWVILSPNEKDLPAGIIYGTKLADSIIIGTMTWFMWSSKRNILEGALNFLNKMRKEVHLIGTAEYKDKRFFEQLCRYGVIRRSGTFNQCDPILTIFESRKTNE